MILLAGFYLRLRVLGGFASKMFLIAKSLLTERRRVRRTAEEK